MSTFSPKPDSSYYISPALWEEPCCYWAVEDVHKKVTLRGLDIVDNSLVKLQFVKQANSDYYAIKSVKGYLGLDGAKLTVCAKDETPTLFSIHQIGAYVTFAQQHNPLSLLQCEDGYRGNSTDIQIYAHSVTNTTFTDYSQIPDDLFPFLWKLDDVDINPRHWMSHPALDTTKKLNQLALCGTHDTATYKWSRGNYSKTQDQSIYKQLTFGIRYLDIRLGIDLETYHGGSNDVSFKSVLDQISEFFSAPGCADETIIMAINRDDGGGKSAGDEHQFVLQLDQIMKGTSNLIPPHTNIKWYRENRVPQLSEVKGHIVLVRRYPATTNNNLGINLSMWGSTHDNDSFTATGIAGVNSVVVQDEYLLTQNSTKEGFIKSLFPNMISPTDTDDNWYLNFTSAAKGENPYSYSDEINPWLGTWLNFQTQLAGTFVMDYPSAALVGRIVRFNF